MAKYVYQSPHIRATEVYTTAGGAYLAAVGRHLTVLKLFRSQRTARKVRSRRSHPLRIRLTRDGPLVRWLTGIRNSNIELGKR